MKQALIKLHISVFLAGFTGVLGVLIGLNEGLLVWYRIFVTVIILLGLLSWKKMLSRIPLATAIRLAAIGTLIALHWVAFYGSIKYANVSIALVCFASTGLFTALLEPVFTVKRFSIVEVLLGLISLLGIALIFHFDGRYRTGILLGIASALLNAFFSILNKKNVNVAPPQTIMLYELGGGLLVLTACLPLYLHFSPAAYIFPTGSDWFWLLVLASLCTVLAMNLTLQALRKVSAFTQNLSFNLEPVYGIILAFILFKDYEHLQADFYVGLGLILLSVVLQVVRIMKYRQV